jgi:hypothetical protein
MRLRTIAVAMTCAACAPTTETVVLDNRGYAELLEDADRHEAMAAELDAKAEHTETALGDDRYYCGDTVLHEQSMSGTEQVTHWNPCYDASGPAAERQRQRAQAHRDQARRDRASASALARSRTL